MSGNKLPSYQKRFEQRREDRAAAANRQIAQTEMMRFAEKAAELRRSAEAETVALLANWILMSLLGVRGSIHMNSAVACAACRNRAGDDRQTAAFDCG